MRHRYHAPSDDDSSSSSSDAFANLSAKKCSQNNAKNVKSALIHNRAIGINSTTNGSAIYSTETSSNKRHHHQSSKRAAKMDALLQELEDTPVSNNPDQKINMPEKIGSYCSSTKEENSTTNIFVGANLSPLTTEEQLTDLFRQFGDLYSVKIMWPRSAEQQARGRNSGFVCFMNRDDAQDAMDTLQSTDPFNNGRLMSLNWGRNVNKILKSGVDSVPIPPIRGVSKTSYNQSEINTGSRFSMSRKAEYCYDPLIHSRTAIAVKLPRCPRRYKFISTVAFFVAKDGSRFEDKLINREKCNPLFHFMRQGQHNCDDTFDNDTQNEQIFYRWRVYAFKQGDTHNRWHADPFIMIKPNGRFWIPPPINKLFSEQKEIEDKMKAASDDLMKNKRRGLTFARKAITKGRKDEYRRLSSGDTMLNSDQLSLWNKMMKRLCCSRETICVAMAFCFDNSIAAQHISKLLKESLLENSEGISIDTKCARLFLMSDILFNSQQGVKNAFQYRDAIEEMAPEVFTCLGQHGNGKIGRISMNKLRATIRKVLSAWNSWSVYNPTFLDDLESLFEGHSIEHPQCNDATKPDLLLDLNENTRLKLNVADSIPSSIWMSTSKIDCTSAQKEPDNKSLSNVDEKSPGKNILDPTALINEEVDGESLGSSELSRSSENYYF